MGVKKKRLLIDPLYQLFEQQLVTRSYEDSAAFTKDLAKSYLAYLDSTPAHVPYESRGHLLEDLETEAHEMLVKKIYGCVRIDDHVDFGRVVRIELERVQLFGFDPLPLGNPLTPEEP